MKLLNSVQNEAILSNVGEVGEFRIRNSAKAFSILSSGLYSNKIRAIIRELSCNAVDSHIAAGNASTPYDIHLPNALEPWFSIRDYGLGLTHDQVINLYTTYFESTKTDSNEFIGALGLGSKSPFSYIDNFTVTAIKDGRKGIYTAFINEHGIPSIALMMEEETTDPNGVEVRFAVDQRYDFDKFRSEARFVYEYFSLRPVVSGNADFKFIDPSFKTKDIIPGVHETNNRGTSFAVMGNIKYPIDVPNADKVLGPLHKLLHCGLILEFGIGELDFQASREGLSYIPETIEAIKTKLTALNNKLAVHVATEANKIVNMWERTFYLTNQYNQPLWSEAVVKYVTDTKFDLITFQHSYCTMQSFDLTVSELENKYNIIIRAFCRSKYNQTCSTVKVKTKLDQNVFTEYWTFHVNEDHHFVINDTNVGATERAKYHWRNSSNLQNRNSTIFVIEAANKTKPVNVESFFEVLRSPPESKRILASSLAQKERVGGLGKNVSILRLEERRRGRWSKDWVWANAGKLSVFDKTKTYCYVEMNGWTPVGISGDVKVIRNHLVDGDIYSDYIYGVRKNDVDAVKKMPNWINLTTFVLDALSKMDKTNVMSLVKSNIDFTGLYKYNATVGVETNSPYLKLYNEFKDVKVDNPTVRCAVAYLCKVFDVTTDQNVDPNALIDQYKQEVEGLFARYPLLKHLSGYSVERKAITEYINLIDTAKGV